MDCSPPVSVHGISQARTLEWVAISFSRGSSWPRDQTCVPCISSWILYSWATREALIIRLTYTSYKFINPTPTFLSTGIWLPKLSHSQILIFSSTDCFSMVNYLMISYFENRLSLTIYKLNSDFLYNVLQGHRISFHKILLYKNSYIINCDNYFLKSQL